jgi:hypothetical protein
LIIRGKSREVLTSDKADETYIELSDFIGLRFECSSCKASLSIPFGSSIDVKKLRFCPNCNEPWTTISGGSSVEPKIADFIECFKQMKKILSGDFGFPKFFSMTFEIAGSDEDELKK